MSPAASAGLTLMGPTARTVPDTTLFSSCTFSTAGAAASSAKVRPRPLCAPTAEWGKFNAVLWQVAIFEHCATTKLHMAWTMCWHDGMPWPCLLVMPMSTQYPMPLRREL